MVQKLSIWRFRGFWRDRMNRNNNIADRFGPRVSNFPSYGIAVFIKIDDFRSSWIFHGSHGGPHGTPWDPMRPHGTPWDPMGTHVNPWEPMGPHGTPWDPIVLDFRGGRGSGRQKPRLDARRGRGGLTGEGGEGRGQRSYLAKPEQQNQHRTRNLGASK